MSIDTKKIAVGKVNSIFGIKGEVKIISYCDHPQKIEEYPLFDANGHVIKLRISNKNKTIIGKSGTGESILIAKIEGVDDRTSAEKLRGCEFFTNRDDFKELAEEEFYYVDLIGLDVVDIQSKKIGKVVNVFDFGAGGVIEIEFLKSGIKSGYGKIENFPFKNSFFPEVSLSKGFVRMDLPEIVSGEVGDGKRVADEENV